MEIKYLGHASFLIKTKTAKVVTDPYDSEMVGMKFPKVEADIVTVSHHHHDHDQTDLIPLPPTGAPPLIIDMAGEFEKMGVRVFGYKSFHDDKKGEERGENILYKFEAEGISVLHCGDLGFVPDDSFLDSIGDVDILLVPTGGFFTVDSSQAAELVKKIEPSIVIPMHFNQPKLNQKNFGQLEKVEEFTKKFGLEKPVPLPKLVYKKEEIEEEMKVVVLEI
ncbi:MBL fold metallo-hydrolase [Candidatus Roizmanbacteria bacterium]|nr:MBL fold metallo-hydrolase [Candidatus Roizmanbacteria bacterium]